MQVLDLHRKLDMKGEAAATALVSRKTILALVEKYLEEEADEADGKSGKGSVEKQPEKCEHGPWPWSKTGSGGETQTEGSGKGAEKDGDDDWST